MLIKDVSIAEKERLNRQLLRTIYRAEWLAISIISAISLGLIIQAFNL